MSWEPFKGKLGDHTSFLKSPLRSACIKRSARHSPWINAFNTSLTVFSGEDILNLKAIPFGRNSQKKKFLFVEISSQMLHAVKLLKEDPKKGNLFQVSAF